MAYGSKKTVQLFSIFLMFSALFSLRLIHLGADPPKNLDPVSPGYICDPGAYARNARNEIVTGEAKTDDWGFDFMYVTPLPHGVFYLVFLLFGAGMAQMNLVPAVFSCLTLLLVYLILKKATSPAFALLGAGLLGVNFLYIMFSRVANMTMPMLFFVCLTVYLLMLAGTKKRVLFFVAGVTGFICFTVTGMFLTILPAVVLGMLAYLFFQSGRSLKVTLTSFGVFASGLGLTFAVWFPLFYLPHRILFLDFARENMIRMFPRNWYRAALNFWARPLFILSRAPVITLLAVFFLLFLGYAALRTPRKISLPAWICGFWILSNYPYLSTIFYRPLRHDILLLFPAVLLAAMALFEFSRARSLHRPEKTPFLFYLFFFFWGLFFLSDLMILQSRPSRWGSVQSHFLVLLALSLGMTLLLAVAIKSLPRSLRIPLAGRVKTAIIGGLVALSFVINLKPYLAWAFSPRYDLINISRDLGKAYATMSIAGLVAPTIVMENRHAAYGADYHFYEKKDFLQKCHITHLFIIPQFNEIGPFRKQFPEVMDKARLVARYHLWKAPFELWALHPDSSARDGNGDLFEGETFFATAGIPRFDPSASAELAFLFEKGRNTRIQLGKFAYPPGTYDVAYFLKTEDVSLDGNSVARIEVINSDTRSILASRRVSGEEFSLPGGYRDFHMRLILKKRTNLRFRIQNTGNAALFFDKVCVRKMPGPTAAGPAIGGPDQR
jgi:4-amino-4-deoxy-L-arabinose transferase-like glycosyltransferase